MSQPSFRIPEPTLPEHELVKSIAELPELSPDLRHRVLQDCHFQIRYGRWMDRLRIIGAMALLLLMGTAIWSMVSQWLAAAKPAPAPVQLPEEATPSPVRPAREPLLPGQSLADPPTP